VLFRDYLAVRKCAAPVVGWLCFYWLSHCRIWLVPQRSPGLKPTKEKRGRGWEIRRKGVRGVL
jgi:hypothetical protein